MLYTDSQKYKFISLRAIIDRVMMTPLMEDLPYDVAILATVDCIRLIENPVFMRLEDVYIDIEENRGLIPENVVNIKKVVRVEDDTDVRYNMGFSSDPFFYSYADRGVDDTQLITKYKIQGEYIYVNFESGKVHMAYEGIPLDSDNMVMIPDRASIIKAVEFSIQASWLQKKWFAGKVTPDKFQWADRERNWYISKASADFMLENLDKKQGLANIINTLLLNEEHYNNDFSNLGDKEYRKRQV